MRLRITLFFLIALLGSQSCSKEDPIEKEQRLLKEQLEGFKTDVYKTVKVSLRCSKDAAQNQELAEARNSILMYGITVFERVMVPSEQAKYDSAGMPTPNIVELGKAAWKAKDVLLKHDEDEFPTVMENIIWMLDEREHQKIQFLFNLYDNNTEHLLFGGLWAASPKVPVDFALYEFTRVDDNELTLTETQVITKLGRSLALYKGGYFWLSEKNMNEYLNYLERNKEAIIKEERLSYYVVYANTTIEGAHYYEMHGMGALMRALARREIGKEEESLNDLEIFLEDAEKAGMENEVVWMTGAYVHISKEQHEKAIVYLTKLENSNLLTDVERQSVRDIKEYLKTREKGDVLNFIKDKIAFASITVRLFQNEMERSKYAKELQETEHGKEFLKLKHELENALSSLNTTENVTDSLSNKATDLVKTVFN